MGEIVGFGALIFQLIFLAVVLCFVGFHLNRIISTVMDSRRAQAMKAEGLVAASRARASARANAKRNQF